MSSSWTYGCRFSMGVAATVQIRRDFPDTPILMLTTFDDDALVLAALQAGANGYLLKDLPPSDLARAIRAANSGIYQLDPTIAAKLITRRIPRPAVPPESKMPRIAELTERERDVLRLVSTGTTTCEIAGTLFIGDATAKSHLSALLARLGWPDRTQAAISARH